MINVYLVFFHAAWSQPLLSDGGDKDKRKTRNYFGRMEEKKPRKLLRYLVTEYNMKFIYLATYSQFCGLVAGPMYHGYCFLVEYGNMVTYTYYNFVNRH